MDEKEGSKPEKQSRHGLLLGILGVLLAVAALLVKVNFPFYLDTWLGFTFLLIFLLSLTWLTVLIIELRKGKQRPLFLTATALLTLISAILVVIVTEPVRTSDEKIDCMFGNVGLGIGKGLVWVKAEVPRDGAYTFHITWGAVEATRTVDLHNEVYFTFRKTDFWSIGYATASISPTATLSCGNNTPPPGVKNIEIVDTDWQKRAATSTGASSQPPLSDTSPVAPINTSAPPQSGPATVHRVYSDVYDPPPVPGINVTRGQTVEVSQLDSRQTWNCAAGGPNKKAETPYAGIEGVEHDGDSELFQVHDQNICLLIARVGSEKDWHPIGPKFKFVAQDSGALTLMVNEIPPERCPYPSGPPNPSCYSDNKGFIDVVIAIK